VSDELPSLNLFFQDIIVRPYIRLVKIVGFGISLLFFVVFSIFLGYRGRGSPRASIPSTIRDLSEYSVHILVFMYCLSGIAFFWFPRLRDIHPSKRIVIDDHVLKVFSAQERQFINLKQVDKLTFKVMPLLHKLFNDRFYRIGRLMVINNNRRFVFYFPVRNQAIAEEISNKILSLKKAQLH
jgi:hypothetical protein